MKFMRMLTMKRWWLLRKSTLAPLSSSTGEEDGVAKVITLYYTTKLDRLIRAKMVRGAWKKTK